MMLLLAQSSEKGLSRRSVCGSVRLGHPPRAHLGGFPNGFMSENRVCDFGVKVSYPVVFLNAGFGKML